MTTFSQQNNRSWRRRLHALIAVIAIAALAVAILFMEKHLGLAPCPLCVIDRLILALILVVAVAACVHHPALWGQRVYNGLHIVLSSVGVAVAARHIYLQNLPADKIPDCLPDLDYMLEAFSWSETLTMIFSSAGECAAVQWTFLGLSIPEQTLILFVVLSVLAVINLISSE